MLKVGVIGLGVGMKHLEGYEKHPACEVVGICDLSAEKRTEGERKYTQLFVTKDPAEILNNENINIISVAGYDDSHFEHVFSAIKSGKHVFVEKPLCQYPEQAKKIKHLLSRYPAVRLSSNMVLRSCPRFISLKDAVQSGGMGEIVAIEADYLWGRVRKLTTGWRAKMDHYSIVLGAAIHMIDIVIWMIEKKPIRVVAFGNKIGTKGAALKFDSYALILLIFENGLIAKVTGNGCAIHPHFHSLRIFGEKQTALHDLFASKVLYDSGDSSHGVEIKGEYPAKEHRFKVQYTFIDSIIGRKVDPLVPVDDIFDVMSICFAAEKSIRETRIVTVDYL